MSLPPSHEIKNLGRSVFDTEEIFKYLNDRGLEVRRKGDEFEVKECPFCDAGKSKPDNQYKLYVNANTGAFFCHRCREQGSAREFVSRLGGNLSFQKKAQIKNIQPSFDNQKPVRDIWSASIALDDPNAAIGRQYLVSRGLSVPENDQIRFCHELWHGDTQKKYPALIFKISSPDGELVGVQRIFLNSDGTKASITPNKMALGKTKGNAIKFDVPDDVLHLAEGPETSLAVRQAIKEPTWSTVSANGLEAIRIPEHVRKVFIWADKDKSETGEYSAESLFVRLANEDKTVRIVLPEEPIPDGSKCIDWLDVFKAQGESSLIRAYQHAETQGSSNSDNWKEPEKLPEFLPKVDPLDPDQLLPNSIRDWLVDISERMQVPLELPAMTALTALGSIIGRRVCIRPKSRDDWRVFPNLWGLMVAPPSMLKSPVINEVLKPLYRLAEEAQSHFEGEVKERAVDLSIAQKRKEKLERDVDEYFRGKNKEKINLETIKQDLLKIDEEINNLTPVQTRYYVNDATSEKLQEILKSNPAGVLLLRDELIGFLRSLEKQGRDTDRAFFLEAWNGCAPFNIDRISRGTTHLKAVSVSIFGGIQPSVLQRYFSEVIEGDSGGDGLFSRFQLAVYPETLKKYLRVDKVPDGQAREQAQTIFRTILKWGDGTEPREVAFSSGAQDLYYSWSDELGTRLLNDDLSEAFHGLLGKYRSLMPALALIYEAAEVAATGQMINSVSFQSAQMAAVMCDYLEQHARKIYAGSLRPEIRAAEALGRRIKKGDIKDGSNVRTIKRRGWANLRSSDQVDQGLSFLEDLNWLKVLEVKSNRGGGRCEVIRLNPKLKPGA